MKAALVSRRTEVCPGDQPHGARARGCEVDAAVRRARWAPSSAVPQRALRAGGLLAGSPVRPAVSGLHPPGRPDEARNQAGPPRARRQAPPRHRPAFANSQV